MELYKESDFVEKYPKLSAAIKGDIPDDFHFVQLIDYDGRGIEICYADDSEDNSIVFEAPSKDGQVYATDGVEGD